MWKRLGVKRLLFVLIASVGAYVLAYGPRVFATKVDEEVSPKGYYRLEYLKPGPPYFFSMTKQYPRFVRLYDNRTGALLGESDIVDMNGNGEIFWTSKDSPRIRVGMDIEFSAKPEPE